MSAASTVIGGVQMERMSAMIYSSVYRHELTSQFVCKPNNEVSGGQEVKGCWIRALTPADPTDCAHKG